MATYTRNHTGLFEYDFVDQNERSCWRISVSHDEMTRDEVDTVHNHFGGPKTKGAGEPSSTKSVNEDLQSGHASHFIS